MEGKCFEDSGKILEFFLGDLHVLDEVGSGAGVNLWGFEGEDGGLGIDLPDVELINEREGFLEARQSDRHAINQYLKSNCWL